MSQEERELIKEFREKNQQYFQDWFNGMISKDKISYINEITDDDWLLVNKKTPEVINNKETFLDVWPKLHGQHEEKEFEQSQEIQRIKKLSSNIFLVTSIETTIMNNTTSSRPQTSIIKLDKESGNCKVLYVHE